MPGQEFRNCCAGEYEWNPVFGFPPWCMSNLLILCLLATEEVCCIQQYSIPRPTPALCSPPSFPPTDLKPEFFFCISLQCWSTSEFVRRGMKSCSKIPLQITDRKHVNHTRCYFASPFNAVVVSQKQQERVNQRQSSLRFDLP